MLELLSRLAPSDLASVLTIVVAAVTGVVIAVVALVIRAIHRYREREIAAAVVAEMLDRGIASQEIVAVLNAMGLEKSDQADEKPARERLRRLRAKLGLS